MSKSAPLVLVDGSSYLYRAFHALPPLSNSRGEPTGAVLGVLNMVLKFLREQQPQLIAVVFDAPGRTFRDQIFAEYKAHRPAMPTDLRAQIEPLFSILQALHLPLLRIEGVEADDVIATLACRAARQGYRVIISTIDKDMAQLVSEAITVVNTMSQTTLDRAGVKAKFDVYPEQIIDYLALVGDTSDNIPGIPKVGPKTAAKWLGRYGTLDELIAHAGEIEGKVGENLRAGLTTLELSRRLATLHADIDLPVSIEDLRPGEPDRSALRALYTRYELRALLRQLEESGGALAGAAGAARPSAAAPQGSASLEPTPPAGRATETPQILKGAAPPAPAAGSYAPTETALALARIPAQYETVLEWAQLERWIASLRETTLVTLATQGSSSDSRCAALVGIALCDSPGRAAYVPLGHDYAGAPAQLERARVLEALRPLLEDPERPKLGHHLKRDAHVLLNHGIALRGMRYDTMLESYVWNSVATRHDTETEAARYLGTTPLRLEEVAGRGAKQLPFNQVPLERAAEYAAQLADVTLRLHQALWPELESVPALAGVYVEIEQPLVPVLLRMERRGVLIERERLRAQSREISTELAQLLERARQEAGCELNLESPKQLQQVLFERLQLPVLRKTPTGQPSTAEDVLEELAASYALPRIILDYRALAKLKSTYSDKLPEQIDETTGRVHTSYQQAVAATGRLSSADPNLQNIPIRSAQGRRIRQAFIAPPGQLLLAADYSQIELRIMAHLSGDPGLLSAFAEDRDVHQATAAEIFGVPLQAVSADQRRLAKTINFGLIYGMSPFGLARQLGIDRTSAQGYVERYFARYPAVKRFMDETRVRARQMGYVETVYGRRLYLPDIRSSNRPLQQYAERAAINAPMQGTAADIIKRAMIEVDAWCERESAPARLLLQVHDELVLEVRADAAQELAAAVRERMVGAAELAVPLRVEIGIGANWDEAH
ncbi:MAG TPA: DNA polymerase I [Steroidobacteraceae bacterium]|nr:DNA polymerase I [Steroidobacteraceae bacterium]